MSKRRTPERELDQTTQPALSGLFYESTDMNQLKEAARLALDALSNASWHLPEGKDIDQQCEKAINALRAALALPDAEPVQWQKRHPVRTSNAWEPTDEHDAKWWIKNSIGWH